MSIQNKLKAFMSGKIEAQKTAGAAFMAENISKPGVKELPGGIQYEVIKEGTGAMPLVSESVKAHYKGTLLDGKEFDNSFKRGQPFTAPLRALIKGWQALGRVFLCITERRKSKKSEICLSAGLLLFT